MADTFTCRLDWTGGLHSAWTVATFNRDLRVAFGGVTLPMSSAPSFHGDPARPNPEQLFVAALSGHHATLSREIYSTFLPDHDVYVTDWQDARYVPVEAGRFGFDDYVRYVTEFLDYLGPDTHVVAICQAAPFSPDSVRSAMMPR